MRLCLEQTRTIVHTYEFEFNADELDLVQHRLNQLKYREGATAPILTKKDIYAVFYDEYIRPELLDEIIDSDEYKCYLSVAYWLDEQLTDLITNYPTYYNVESNDDWRDDDYRYILNKDEWEEEEQPRANVNDR